MKKSELLYSSYKLGRVELRNRIVMAPMTRSRSIGNIPGELVAKYYEQRAEAGLIVTEGTSPSPNGLGYARIPGLYTLGQARAWRKVTDAVHARGGKIFVQLMHTGRVSHPANMPSGARVLAPSAIAAPGTMWTDSAQMQAHPVPVEMSEKDIQEAIDEFVRSAVLAVNEAGFDGVELHGANGYLIDQFLNPASNQRKDAWGGSINGRIRFATEVARRVADRIGTDRTAMRVSPYGVFNGMAVHDELDETFTRLVRELDRIGLVYLHVVDHSSMGAPEVKPELKRNLRSAFGQTYILSGGYEPARAESDLREERGDLVAFGRPFIANPDLVKRFEKGLPLAQPDQATFYTPDEKGYTDYPVSA